MSEARDLLEARLPSEMKGSQRISTMCPYVFIKYLHGSYCGQYPLPPHALCYCGQYPLPPHAPVCSSCHAPDAGCVSWEGQQTPLALPLEPLLDPVLSYSHMPISLALPSQTHVLLGLPLTGPFPYILRNPLSHRNILPFIPELSCYCSWHSTFTEAQLSPDTLVLRL